MQFRVHKLLLQRHLDVLHCLHLQCCPSQTLAMEKDKGETLGGGAGCVQGIWQIFQFKEVQKIK